MSSWLSNHGNALRGDAQRCRVCDYPYLCCHVDIEKDGEIISLLMIGTLFSRLRLSPIKMCMVRQEEALLCDIAHSSEY